jgi:hypothetical protein
VWLQKLLPRELKLTATFGAKVFTAHRTSKNPAKTWDFDQFNQGAMPRYLESFDYDYS